MFLGSRVGGMLSAPIALVIVVRWGWRASFVAFGTLGLAWGAAWFAWYRDAPAEHPDVGDEELAAISGRSVQASALQETERSASLSGERNHRRTPWADLLHSRNLYAICAMYFAFGYGLYFYFTWLPTYLIAVLGFSVFGGGLFAALPFVLAGFADLAGGWLTDRISSRYGLRAGRCYLGCAAFSTCAAFVFASTLPMPAIAKAAFLACALASADLALGACWAVPIDFAPDHAGVVTGCMNTLGNLGGLLCPLVIGFAVDRWGSWTFPFYVTAAVYASGGVAWLAIDPTSGLVTRESRRATT